MVESRHLAELHPHLSGTTGHFRVWGRITAGGGPYTGLTLSLVTSGQGTSSQATQTLGTFSDSTANGWQNWHWVPLVRHSTASR